ncbi:MAG: alpha/beta hydrolase [Bacteroidota bacterium]|nr:MAG: alpha/beta hydrolase [Bacteroidota bacterium]
MALYDHAHTALVQGNSLRYYREGKGETVLFVHGITTYSFIWKNIVPFFTETYDVVLVDLLGCGDSDKPLDQDFSLKKQAHLLKEFCDTIGIKKMHLVCHDVGGGIGQIMAVNYPELLYDLVLINSVAYNFWPVQPIVTIRTPIIRQIAMAVLDFGMFELVIKRGLYYKAHLSKEFMDMFIKPMQDPLGRKAFLHFAKCLDNKNLTEIEDRLRQLRLPVLIIRGEADVYLGASIAEKLHNEIPNSKLVKIKTGGHFIQIDEPQKVSEAISAFIQEKH